MVCLASGLGLAVSGASPALPAGTASGSRLTGQDMHRGPPRKLPSSLLGTRMTRMPASSRRALVSEFRSCPMTSCGPIASTLLPSSH
jgi:hypothetical protein